MIFIIDVNCRTRYDIPLNNKKIISSLREERTIMKISARLHQTLGEYLKEKRMESGFTQSEVADKLGYSSPQFVSNFERGLCSPPVSNLKTLVKLYKISTDEVVRLIIKEQERDLRHALGAARKR